MVQAGSTSHQKAAEHRVLRQRHQQLKLVARRSGLAGRQHDLGHLLLSVVLAVHDPQPKQVTVEGDRRLQIGDGDTDMIKTESDPGSTAARSGGLLVMHIRVPDWGLTKLPDVIVSRECGEAGR